MQPLPPDQEIPEDPSRMLQGTVMDCIYCSTVYSELGDKCPVCKGSGPSFKPGRMMTDVTAREEILSQLMRLAELEKKAGRWGNIPEGSTKEDAKAFKRELLELILLVGQHQFDIQKALVERLYQVDRDHDMEPEDEFGY